MPEPFGPTRPTWSPSRRPKDSWSKSVRAPYALVTTSQLRSSDRAIYARLLLSRDSRPIHLYGPRTADMVRPVGSRRSATAARGGSNGWTAALSFGPAERAPRLEGPASRRHRPPGGNVGGPATFLCPVLRTPSPALAGPRAPPGLVINLKTAKALGLTIPRQCSRGRTRSSSYPACGRTRSCFPTIVVWRRIHQSPGQLDTDSPCRGSRVQCICGVMRRRGPLREDGPRRAQRLRASRRSSEEGGRSLPFPQTGLLR